ncbi:MAG: hypothetical protein L3K17_00855 [Thermoplasmata archaeon]|nr:hypothetical protein [Thermoplasmata archaeon]
MSFGRNAPNSPDHWISASELADYAYCPRSWWYRDHPPVRGPAPESRRRAREGEIYHHHVLAAERHRDAWAGAIAAAAMVAVAVLAFLLLFGGALP